MKRAFLLVLLGLVVILMVFWHPIHQRLPEPPTPPKEALPMRLARQVQTGAAPKDQTNALPEALWQSIESRDPAQLIANLRAIGCPEQTIRDLVTFRLFRSYYDQYLAKEDALDTSWEAWSHPDLPAQFQLTQWQAQLKAAAETHLESLLGVSAETLRMQVLGRPDQEPAHPFLSLEKQALVRAISLRYRQWLDQAKRGLFPGDANEELQARARELSRQEQTELADCLTPRELEWFNLRNSAAARYARAQLPEATSEEEFLDMVRAVQQTGIELPPSHPLTSRYGTPLGSDASAPAETGREQADRQVRLEAQLNQLLGEARVAEWKGRNAGVAK